MKISEDYLDNLWSKVVRLLYSERCAVCKREGGEAHHLIGRRNRAFRWHPLNGVLLCHKHHRWAHEHPAVFKQWVRKLTFQYRHCIEQYKEHNVKPDRDEAKALLLKTEEMLTRRVIGRQR